LFLIDIAVPRDIDTDVQELENVYLYNVDHLEAIVRENLKLRQQELTRCQAILGERTASLMPRLAPPPPPERTFVLDSPPNPAWIMGRAMACAGH
jgi:hypothetical protein